MSSTPEDDPSPNEARETFLAGVNARLEQAQASGQSPEQIGKIVSAYAEEQRRRQIPEISSRLSA